MSDHRAAQREADHPEAQFFIDKLPCSSSSMTNVAGGAEVGADHGGVERRSMRRRKRGGGRRAGSGGSECGEGGREEGQSRLECAALAI